MAPPSGHATKIREQTERGPVPGMGCTAVVALLRGGSKPEVCLSAFPPLVHAT